MLPLPELFARVLRALLPSWRFFDEIEPAPVLFTRCARDAELGAWQRSCWRPQRGPAALLLNPAGNLALAEHALLEQLLGDLDEAEVQSAEDVERLTSYALVANLARRRLLAAGATGARFQFKLTLPAPDGLGEDRLISRLHEV